MGKTSRASIEKIVKQLLSDPNLGLTEAEARAIATGEDTNDDAPVAAAPVVPAPAPAPADHAAEASRSLEYADPDGWRGALQALARIEDRRYTEDHHRALDLAVAHGVMALVAEQRRTNTLLESLLAAQNERA